MVIMPIKLYSIKKSRQFRNSVAVSIMKMRIATIMKLITSNLSIFNFCLDKLNNSDFSHNSW